MDFTFKDCEIEKFAEKIQYIPEWFQQFFQRIHKKDKSSEYYKGCFATLRFILKFRKSTDKDRVIFYSLPCLSKLILDKINNENEDDEINNEVDVEEMFKDLVLNINYVYKGHTNIEDVDLDEMFKKMQDDSKNEENQENQENEENEKNEENKENKEEDNQDEENETLSNSEEIEIIELDGDIIKDNNTLVNENN
jgi:hypothetical protein